LILAWGDCYMHMLMKTSLSFYLNKSLSVQVRTFLKYPL